MSKMPHLTGAMSSEKDYLLMEFSVADEFTFQELQDGARKILENGLDEEEDLMTFIANECASEMETGRG